MSETTRIADLYDSIYDGDEKGEAWHGLALKPLLKGVTAEQASRTPIQGKHSILQLVLHIAYWEEIVLRRFNGEVVDAPLNSPDDWPANRKISPEGWKSVLDRLDRSHIALRRAIAECSDEKLAKKVPGRNHDNYALLHGIIHHCVYHGGQIALVRKEVK